MSDRTGSDKTGDEYEVKADAPSAAYVDPDPRECPVIPLGWAGGDIWVATPEGELRQVGAGGISRLLVTDLFASIEGRIWLSQWRGDDGKIKLQDAGRWLVNACRALPKWDGRRPERGYGLWRDLDGSLTLHVGDALIRYSPSGARKVVEIAEALRTGGPRDPVWRLLAPAPRPPVKPAGTELGQAILKDLRSWNWRPLDGEMLDGADVVAGWQMMAAQGGAPPFRVILALIGGRGTGKTTLMKYLHALNSAISGDLMDSFTEAGLRGALSGEARAVYLDEAEPHPSGEGPAEKALELLRRMATGDGAARKQADGGGGVASQTALGAVAIGAINPLAMGMAMASRMVEVRLRPLGAAQAGAEERLEAMRLMAAERSPALLARAIAGAARYRADVSAIKAAMGEMLGTMPRQADLVAALAAGRRLLLHDEALDAEGARAEVELWSPLIEARAAESAGNEGQDCLYRILSISAGKIANDRYMTLGELIPDEITSPGFASYGAILKSFGLRAENGAPGTEFPGPWLFVANKHPALERALKDSAFGNWRGVLEHLADLGDEFAPRAPRNPVRFGPMVKERALGIPLTPWLERPVPVGVDRGAPSPFGDPEWGPASRASSRPASRNGGVDA